MKNPGSKTTSELTEHLGVKSIGNYQTMFEGRAETEAAEENDTLAISEAELKTLEANAQKQKEEDDVHLGAESTPGVELEHHKTHPAIH